ncbi:MAG: MotA/TolQ/ExbB proton channel family protein [Planctomycetia bacterium]|nr:MotA/TolQ/ExbB proton channel family protein [Planctomycetia bacterium]
MKKNDPMEMPRMSWARDDIEQRFGLRGGAFTNVRMSLSFIFALVATIGFYAVLELFFADNPFTLMFTARGITPYPTVFLGWWVLFILLIKSSKIRFQKRALQYCILPDRRNFVLTPYTVEEVMVRIYDSAEQPKDFVLFNRILLTLSNLRNIGKVSDVDDILHSQAELDENGMETSYNMIAGFLWAIPILGFIGTVLGLSQAIGTFADVLKPGADITNDLVPSLTKVTGGLSTAFDTTFIALVIALVLQLFLTSIKKSEEEFFNACSSYCAENIVSRLKIDYVASIGADHNSPPLNGQK